MLTSSVSFICINKTVSYSRHPVFLSNREYSLLFHGTLIEQLVLYCISYFIKNVFQNQNICYVICLALIWAIINLCQKIQGRLYKSNDLTWPNRVQRQYKALSDSEVFNAQLRKSTKILNGPPFAFYFGFKLQKELREF